MPDLPRMPPFPPSEFNLQSGYNICLQFEKDVYSKSSKFTSKFDDLKFTPPALVCARILGYLIIHAPSVAGRYLVANEVISCNYDVERLAALGRMYYLHYIRVCE
jgi:hypothetical protein